MNDDRGSSDRNWSFSELQRIDAVCDEFERAWTTSAPVAIEQLLVQNPKLPRATLLDQLLRLELHLRRAAGESPLRDHYQQRFPTDDHVVSLVWEDFVANGKSLELPSTATLHKNLRSPAPLPERIGRFQIRRFLGRGSFGAVYLALDPNSGNEVALKVPHPEKVESARRLEDLWQEFLTAKHLDHPNLVRTLSVEDNDGRLVIVQQFIDGQNLTDWYAETRPTPERIVRLLIPVAKALGYLHEQGVFHRDLKPGNILVDRDDNPYVADFGLALHEDQQRDPIRRGELAGTYAYMAPEQVRRQTQLLDGQTDLWSFGVILYRLLTDRFPFGGPPPRNRADEIDYQRDLEFEIEEHDPRPPRQINPTVTRKLEQICLRCLEKRKRDRYQTGHDLAEDLRLVLERSKSPIHESSWETKVQIVPKGLRSFDAADAPFFLELLPGPRTLDGIPVSLNFWRSRLSDSSGEGPIDVGVVYGPSGCGKSSLIRAGLIPLLGDKFVPLVIESTPEDTEVRLLKALRKALPDLPRDGSLVDACRRVGERGAGSGQKVLLIFDQFEQWLHAHFSPAEQQFLDALRHCNGTRLQALLLVRDDFWMPLTRFMDQLEIPLQENNNIAAVDLFDCDHARRVLLGLGRAYRRLPAGDRELTAAQQQFLKSAVEGLSEEGRIICVRLALFAEMMKDRPWTREELTTVGGAKGIGVAFLEGKFGPKAPAVYRPYRAAARKTLEALLPPYGSNLKGEMKIVSELRETAGSASDSSFAQLLHILDADLKLLTPVAPDQPSGQAENTSPSQGPLYYQLTHDYLVPSVREWLTTELRRTSHGRALLRLRERSADWNRQPEPRRLPSLIEWVSIWRHIPRRSLTAAQRRMMTSADCGVFARLGLAAAVFVFVLVVGWVMLGRSQAQSTRDELLSADTSKVPEIAAKAAPLRYWTRRLLERSLEQEFGPEVIVSQLSEDQFRRWLHLVLVLGQLEPDKLADLFDELSRVSPEDLVVVKEMLGPQRQTVIKPLEERLTTALARDPEMVLPLAAMLAWADRDNVQLRGAAEEISRQLRDSRPTHFSEWLDQLKPIAAVLRQPLLKLWQATPSPLGSSRAQLVEALASLGADDAATLATAIQDAEPAEFAAFIPALKRLGNRANEELSRQLSEASVASAHPGPSRPSPPVDQKIRNDFESGKVQGHVGDNGAFALALDPERLESLNKLLSDGGFRPVSVRPYHLGESPRVTAVWHRDSRESHIEVNQTAQKFQSAIEQFGHNDFQMVDVAFDVPRDPKGSAEPRWFGVWARAAAPDTSVDFELPLENFKGREEECQKEGFRLFRYLARADARNQQRYTAIWQRLAPRAEDIRQAKEYVDPPGSFTRTRGAAAYGDIYPGYLQTDLRSQASQGNSHYSGVWRSNRHEMRSRRDSERAQAAGQLNGN